MAKAIMYGILPAPVPLEKPVLPSRFKMASRVSLSMFLPNNYKSITERFRLPC
jgi:hypothetical protein